MLFSSIFFKSFYLDFLIALSRFAIKIQFHKRSKLREIFIPTRQETPWGTDKNNFSPACHKSLIICTPFLFFLFFERQINIYL
jgi:hypothetical protein